jgi:putative nucleotidyltransferase with HDIG domain
VKERYPDTVRLVIADYADRGSVVECVGTAHQFLSKPCHPEELRAAIERACAFKSSVRSERIQNIIAQMESLPSMPSVLNELLQAVQRDDVSIEEVGGIISKDIAMTAKLLQLVNSGFFGLASVITNPAVAASYLGLETVKALLLTTQAFAAFGRNRVGPISLDTLWNHSLQVAEFARKIAKDAGSDQVTVEESFLAGMLHDIGKLALAANLPGQYEKVCASAQTLGLSLHAAEEAAFGAHHGDIGGYMLSLWGLPSRVVSAITCHHEPERDSSERFNPAAAVHIANALAHEASTPGEEHLSARFIRESGFGEHIPRWRELIAA